MALGALEVDPHEESADVAGKAWVVGGLLAGLGEALGDEVAGALGGFVLEIGVEDLSGDLVPGFVLGIGIGEVLLPFFILSPSLHEHDMEGVSHAGGIGRGLEELVDEGGAFVRARVGEEGSSFFRGRDGAGKIEVSATEECGVVTKVGKRLPFCFGLGLNLGVDPFVQGFSSS